MRSRRVATALVALAAGTAVSAVARRLLARRGPAARAVAAPAASVVLTAAPTAAPAEDRDAVVLPFARPVPTIPAPRPAAERARCGDSGGLTKAGAPCAARAGAGGRCHHHPVAA